MTSADPPPPGGRGGLSSPDSVRCSFCGKLRTEVDRVIAGPNGVTICNECVELCSEIIAEERAGDDPPDSAA